jgi:hypothetical protein
MMLYALLFLFIFISIENIYKQFNKKNYNVVINLTIRIPYYLINFSMILNYNKSCIWDASSIVKFLVLWLQILGSNSVINNCKLVINLICATSTALLYRNMELHDSSFTWPMNSALIYAKDGIQTWNSQLILFFFGRKFPTYSPGLPAPNTAWWTYIFLMFLARTKRIGSMLDGGLLSMDGFTYEWNFQD